jgi:hypothetical protein
MTEYSGIFFSTSGTLIVYTQKPALRPHSRLRGTLSGRGHAEGHCCTENFKSEVLALLPGSCGFLGGTDGILPPRRDRPESLLSLVEGFPGSRQEAAGWRRGPRSDLGRGQGPSPRGVGSEGGRRRTDSRKPKVPRAPIWTVVFDNTLRAQTRKAEEILE